VEMNESTNFQMSFHSMRVHISSVISHSKFYLCEVDHNFNYRPAMPFGNRKKYFRDSFKLSIVKIKNILPLSKPEIQ